jgi:hypothetical protein
MRLAAAPEPHLPIRIPVAVADPAAAKKSAAGKAERGKGLELFRFGKQLLNLRAQFRGNHLVGVQSQYPPARGLFRGGILLRNVAFPRLAKNLRAAGRRDLIGAVGHIVVDHHDDFFHPAGDAVQGAADARGFRAGDQTDGQGKCWLRGHALI